MVKIGQNKEIAYSKDFKDLVHKNPGLLKKMVGLIQMAEQGVQNYKLKGSNKAGFKWESEPFLKEDLSVIFLKREIPHLSGQKYFKATVKKDNFFIKKEKIPSLEDQGGVHEFISSSLINKILKNFPGVEVIDYQFAFKDKKNQNQYFISKWENGLVKMDDYINNCKDLNEKKELNRRIDKLRDALRGDDYQLLDFYDHNMFYNPKTKKIVLFDLDININNIRFINY